MRGGGKEGGTEGERGVEQWTNLSSMPTGKGMQIIHVTTNWNMIYPPIGGNLEGIGPPRHTPTRLIGRVGEELISLVRRAIKVAELLAGLTLRHMLLTQSPFIERQYL